MAETRLDLDALAPDDRYKLLSAVVIPRPVAWVTTVDAAGRVNAAPYSFFNLFSEDPATVILGLERRPDGRPKDTLANVQATGAFVVNIATPDLAPVMVATAAAYPPEVSEPEALGLALAPSLRVAPPRLALAPVSIECRLMQVMAIGPGRDLIFGEAVALVAREGLVDETRLRVDWGGEYPVARLFADRYARLEEIERMSIPPVPG
jgi:flavin reductase (DIM6/NTAB) family NADH-FMN oxidoreductase RutF